MSSYAIVEVIFFFHKVVFGKENDKTVNERRQELEEARAKTKETDKTIER